MMQPNVSMKTTLIPSTISMKNSTESTFKMKKNILPMSSSFKKNVFQSSLRTATSSSVKMHALGSNSAMTSPMSVRSLKRLRARSSSREDNEVVEKNVWTYKRFYERTGELKQEVWLRNAVTSGGETSEELANPIKPMLSYEKFYYPDGTTLYSEKWTYEGYGPFPFGFPPFAAEERKEKSIVEKLKEDSFTGIVQNAASNAFMFAVKSVMSYFKK